MTTRWLENDVWRSPKRFSESSFWFSHSSSVKLNTFPSICKQCNTDTVILDHDTTTRRKHGIRIRNFVTESHQLSQSSQKLNHEHVEFCNFQKRFEKSQKYNDRKREREVCIFSSVILVVWFRSHVSHDWIGKRERERRQIFINKMYRFPARVYLVTCWV